MDRETVAKTVEMLGHTPRFQQINARVERVWAVNGRDSRSIGYLSSLEQMSQSKLESWIKSSFERNAR